MADPLALFLEKDILRGLPQWFVAKASEVSLREFSQRHQLAAWAVLQAVAASDNFPEPEFADNAAIEADTPQTLGTAEW